MCLSRNYSTAHGVPQDLGDGGMREGDKTKATAALCDDECL